MSIIILSFGRKTLSPGLALFSNGILFFIPSFNVGEWSFVLPVSEPSAYLYLVSAFDDSRTILRCWLTVVISKQKMLMRSFIETDRAAVKQKQFV